MVMKKISVLLCLLFWASSSEAQSTLNEGFESWPPINWEFYLLGDAVDGWRDDFNGNSHSGTESAYSSIDNAQCDNWMVSPAISITNAEYQLKFWEIHDGVEFYDNASVLVSSGSGDPASGNFVELFESNILNTVAWEERTIDLSAYNGETIFVAFRYKGTWHGWNVDDVSISPSNYVDGSLTQFLNPIGVSETPSIQSVIVQLENTGTTTINDLSIQWEVNTTSQPDYETTGLNLAPGQTTDLNLGDYNFSTEGSYNITSNLIIANDFDSSNNQLETSYDISSIKDGGIVQVTPEGLVPVTGILDVKATITNFGDNTIDIAEVEWSIGGLNQTPFTTTSLNLLSGETKEITIGSYSFSSGVNEISATLNALGDNNTANDLYETKAAVNVFVESFEGVQFPPEGWSINFGVRDNINFDLPVDGNYFYSSFTDNNFFGSVTDTLFTPLLNIENGDRFTFYIKSSAFTPANHSLVWKDGITGEVNFIQTIANSPGLNNWELRDLDISDAVGNNQIGIVTEFTGGYGTTKFDFFTSDAELYQYGNDLKMLNGDMYFLAKQNTSEGFECSIRNSGVLPVSGTDYTVKLMEAPNTELASVSGVDLPSWEYTTIAIDHTFTDVSKKRLFFEIEYSADENSSNNASREASVSVVPNTVEINSIGSPDFRDANIPFTPNGSTQSLGEDDLSQLLFYNDEFSSPGLVHGIAYKYDNLLEADKVVHYPLQVWIAQTDVTNLDAGWLSNDELILVFDGIIEILPGNNRDLYIPFNEPFLINGIENVVIKSYQYDPEWPPSVFRFLSTNISSGPTRSMGVAEVFDLDSQNPPDGFFSFPSFTYTRFVVDPSVLYSELAGVVFDNTTNNPIENATISIAGSNISEQTDINGNYKLLELPYGTYNVTASFNGFQDNTISVDLNEATQIQDFYLDPLEEIELKGTVFGSNAISTPLAFADVSIIQNGSILESVATDANGEFIFPIVYGGSNYEVVVSMYGYFESNFLISPVDTDINLGDIILIEEFISPFDVVVNVDAQPTVNWKSPKLSDKLKLQQDLGVISYSYTNEPNEDVWLGNSFEINEITTLTSVEIQTDIYINAMDFVTIDIFDIASNDIIASSEPFLIQTDSLQTVDIPNIVVTNDVAAMVHWKNNAASTNSLVVDYSDPNIPNAALIKYPNQPFAVFSDFLGGDAPNMSFHVRINTLDDGTPTTNGEVVSYNVYRGLASEFPNTSNWDLLNTSPISIISFEDTDSNIDANENYRYAIETIYDEGESEVTFSNEIPGQLLTNVEEVKDLSSQVLLFPSPTTDAVTVKFDSNLQSDLPMEIYDANGKKILVVDSKNRSGGYITTNIQSLKSGLYFFRININGIDIIKQFVKE